MTVSSPYEEEPLPKLNLWDFIFHNNQREYPDDRVLYIDGATKKKVTFAQHHELAMAFGTGLFRKYNWAKGDVLLVFSLNHIASATITAGTHYVAGTVSTAPVTYTEEQLAWQLRDTRCRCLVVHPEVVAIAKAAVVEAGIDIFLFNISDETVDGVVSWKSVCVIDPSEDLNYLRQQISLDKDPAYILYTSGSTGNPKGVLLSHSNLVAQVTAFMIMDGPYTTQNESSVSFLPFTHIGGIVIREYSARSGFATVVMEKFSPDTMLGYIQNYKTTFQYLVPPVLSALVKALPLVKEYDVSSLKVIHTLGAPLTASLADEVWETLKLPVRDCLGMTEACGAIAANSIGSCRETVGTSGPLLPYFEAKVIDHHGQECSHSTYGRFLVRGPSIMLGYFNLSEVTAKTVDKDGFLDTGDLAYITEAGLVKYVGRAADQGVYQNRSFMTTDIEIALQRSPKIKECCVIALPGADGPAENPRAFVVLVEGVNESEEMEKEIGDFVVENMEDIYHLRGGVRFLKKLPRTAVGKVIKKHLQHNF